jgi:hypothetical protein
VYIRHDFDGDNGGLYVITGNQGVSADTDSFEVEQSQERAVAKRSPVPGPYSAYGLEIECPTSPVVCTYSLAIAAGSSDI